MTLPSISYYLVVDLSLIEIATGSTQTWRFTNRPIVEATSAPTFATLLEVNGLSFEVGSSGLPVKSSGSIVLRDSPGSVGEDRRFVDILERWNPIERAVTVRLVTSTPGTEPSASTLESGGTTLWTGRVTSWEKDFLSENEELTLETEGVSVRRTPLGRTITSTATPTVEALSDNASAIGRVVPIVFGSYEATGTIPTLVPGYSSGTAITGETRYYYGTGLGTTEHQYTPSGGSYNLSRLLVRDRAGFYRNVENGTSETWTGATIGATTISPTGAIQYAVEITGLSQALIVGGRMSFNGLGSAATPAGTLNFQLYGGQYGANYPDDTSPIASAIVEKSVYHATLSAASDFWVEWRWDRAVPYEQVEYFPETPGSLWIVLSMDQYTPGSDFVPTRNGSTGKSARRDTTSVWVPESANLAGSAALLSAAVNWEKTGTDGSGKHLAYAEITASTIAHNDNPDLANLDVVVGTNGIKDTSAGAISGVNYGPIDDPDTAIRLLMGSWDGANWDSVVTANLDYSIFETQRDEAIRGELYPRKIAGFSDGDIMLDDQIEAICKEHALKLFPRPSTTALWGWGTEYPVEFVFSDEEILVEDLEVADKETIVNRIDIQAQNNIIYATNAFQLGVKSGAALYAPDLREDAVIGDLTEQSIRTYGENRNNETSYRYHYGERTARSMGEYLARSFDRPEAIVTFSCSYLPERDIGLGNVVEIVSTTLPAYFGTSPNARKPTHNGAEVNLSDGPWVRAKRYRAQLIGKTYDYDDEGVRIEYKARLVGSYHPNDPT